MPVSIRFHLDENVEIGVAHGLRRRGIDVSVASEAGLLAASDAEHMAFALRESRVIVTHDHDFLRHDAAGVPHAGIAYCAHGSRNIGQIVRHLILLSEVCTPEEVQGRIEYL